MNASAPCWSPPHDELLFIRREKRGTPVYWVTPGGHVEPTDPSREDALRREIQEELAGIPDIAKLIHIIDGGADRQYIYLARIHAWEFPKRSGPEFAETGRGIYALDTVEMTTAGLGSVALKPDALTAFLSTALVEHASLFALPDLRPAF